MCHDNTTRSEALSGVFIDRERGEIKNRRHEYNASEDRGGNLTYLELGYKPKRGPLLFTVIGGRKGIHKNDSWTRTRVLWDQPGSTATTPI